MTTRMICASLCMSGALFRQTLAADHVLIQIRRTNSTRAGCTGNAELDALLEKANLAEVAGLNSADSVYTWQGLCDAMKTANSVGYTMFEGTGQYGVAQAASNIASLLAQCKWESASWTACDENWWNTASPQGACSQRPDNSLYHDLTGPDACPVDPNMRMTAVTKASWAKQIECSPDAGDFPAGTRKCCWWGRGAIQTTGPTNYGLLNKNIIKKASLPEIAGVDLCVDPEAICRPQYPSLKWIGAVEYWVRVVQGFSEFKPDLEALVNNGFVDSSGFNKGAGSAVNNGQWNGHAHAESNRQAIFETLIEALKDAGMSGGEAGPTEGGSTGGSSGGSTGNCCGADWASSVNGQECPSGVDSECPAGQSCFGGHSSCGTAGTTPAPTPANEPSPASTGGCAGDACEIASQCRSEWGHCGSGPTYCNEKSKWKPEGCGSSESTEQSTPQPTPNPTMAPTAAPTPAPTKAPTPAATEASTPAPTTPAPTTAAPTLAPTTTTSTAAPGSASFSRTEWWPGCACGEVEWSTSYKSKASCEAAVC